MKTIGGSKLVDIKGYVHLEHPNSVLFSTTGRSVEGKFLPTKLVEIEEIKSDPFAKSWRYQAIATMPRWLAVDRGFIKHDNKEAKK